MFKKTGTGLEPGARLANAFLMKKSICLNYLQPRA
jgi:hypothetical protein